MSVHSPALVATKKINLGAEIFALQSRTAAPTNVLQTSPGARGVMLWVYVTAKTGSPSVVPQFYALSPIATSVLNAPWKVIWQTAAPIIEIGRYVYILYPGILADDAILCTQTINMPLPNKWMLAMNHGNTDAITYQVLYSYLY